MFSYYFKIARRVFLKEKVSYSINIIGLTMGMVVLFFILLYVQDEYKIDAYHSKADRIYRVYEKDRTKDSGEQFESLVPHQLGGALKSEFPEIEETANLIFLGNNTLKYGDNLFSEKNYTAASQSIFKIWDFEVVEGNVDSEIKGSAGLVLTETCAKKLFGNESAVGKYVYSHERFENIEVMAVIKDMPKNSSFQFSSMYVADYDRWGDLSFFSEQWLKNWDFRLAMTWLLMRENTNPESILEKKEAFLQKYYKEDIKPKHDFYFQNIKDFHFNSNHIKYNAGAPPITLAFNNPKNVHIILVIGFLIIFIAALNYINLSSVQAIKRSKEAGIRKTVGASKSQLVFQLYTETFFTTILAYAVAIVIIVTCLNQFNAFIGKTISVQSLVQQWPYHILIVVLIWLASSIIPSIHFALSGNLTLMKKALVFKGESIRKGFVAFQYCISLMLIIGTIVLFKQLDYVQTKDVGFDKDKLMTLQVARGPVRHNFKAIAQSLAKEANINNVSGSSSVPFDTWSLKTLGVTTSLLESPENSYHFGVDENWLSTYDIKLIQGRNFTGNVSSDENSVILNEKAISEFNLGDDPIGKTVYLTGRDTLRVNVIGVVKDFHFQSLYDDIGPMVLTCWRNPFWNVGNLTIKYSGSPTPVIRKIEALQKQYEPERPANIHFVDKESERFYEADNRRSRLLLIVTIVSIIVSLFGLFGIVNFTIEIMTKEISIRKVLGAKSLDVLKLLFKDYLVLFVIAFLIATPIAYLALNRWLDTFTYRITITPKIFTTALLFILLISSLTILFKVLKVLHLKPIVKLREE